MKKTTFFVMLMMMVSSAVTAQTTVKGELKDKSSEEGVPYATVRVFKTGTSNKSVAMFLTDVNGLFSQKVEGNGKFDIVFSSVGKSELRQTVELSNQGTLDLGTLYIQDDDKLLKDVEVVAQKPLVKMEVDKMSYNVLEDEDSKSFTVLDMLRKVPMVTVDGQDNITVNGSSSFKVYVDGVPNPMISSNPSMVFKSMPATAVKNIEVVTNPGAKYDAEGAAGVLNIVLNRQALQGGTESMNGYNGTIRAAVGNKQSGGGVFVSGQQGKLSYSADVMFAYSTPGTVKTETEQKQDDGSTQLMYSKNDLKTPFTMGSLSLGYQLDSMSVVNATASVTGYSIKNNGSTRTVMNGAAFGDGLGYTSVTKIRNNMTQFSGSLDYQRFFNADHTHSLVFTYQLNFNPTKTKMNNDFDIDQTGSFDLTDRYSRNKEKTLSHIFQVDYSRPIATGQSVNLGGKFQLHDANSDAKYYLLDVYDPTTSSEYEYKNSIVAGYGEYVGNWDKLGVKAGLRYEHTWQDVEYHLGDGQDFSTDYGTLVPSASLQYTLGMGSNLGLAYNMRISRPGISYLNPYVNKTNPIALTYGNPNLDVEKAHNVAMVFNMFTTKLMVNLNLHHNFVDNAISEYNFYDNNNLLNTTYGNVVKRHQTGLNGYVNYLVHKNTRLFFNGSVNYTDLRSNELNQRNSGWTGEAILGLQQTLPWKLQLSAYAITSTKTYTLQGWSGGYNLLTSSLAKTLLKDKLTLSLTGVMGLNKGGKLNIETFSRGQNFTSYNNIKVPIYGVTFTVSYTFGNAKMATRQQTSRVKNDFIEHQSQGEMINNAGSMQQNSQGQ